ncbi:MAG: hypothetical protein COA44_07925 [Arcobacter sp.]|nr:MAG: hypothetical protein COA44_07925 [Arcobacter sp.]
MKLLDCIIKNKERIKATHFLVVFILLINIIFFTTSTISIIIQVILIISIILHNEDDKTLDKNSSYQQMILNAVINSSEDLIFYKDYKNKNGVYIGCNDSFGKLVGKTKEEIIGKNDIELFGEEVGNSFRDKDKNVIKNQVDIANDEWVTYPTGENVLLDTHKSLLKDPAGNTIGLLGMSRNITTEYNYKTRLEEHQNTLELRVQEKTKELNKSRSDLSNQFNLMNTIIDSVPIRIFWKDKNGIYLGANQLFLNDAGLNKASDIIGKSDFEMTWRESAQQFIEDDADIVNSGVPRLNYEEVQPKEDGSAIHIRTSKVPLVDSNNNILGVLGIYDDITLSRNMEDDLLKAKDSAEQANATKSQFLANMSHELRTPLNAIIGFIELIKASVKDEKISKYANIVHSSSLELSNIIGDILDITKLENGKVRIDIITCDASFELEPLIKLFRHSASQKNITLNFISDKNLPQYLNTDLHRVKQIMSNLLSNAIKFTQSGKNINVKISYEDNHLCVSVKDQGKGIASDKLEHIFEVFNQEDLSTTREYGGTGLGLSISHELTQLLGGELKVKSELGVGSEFYFCIPTEVGEALVTKNIESVFENNNNNDNFKILLAEDNEFNQELMKEIFEIMELHCDVAENGLVAFDKFKANKYDLVLMDENMPIMGGIKSTQNIREYEKENSLARTMIVALSANALKDDQERFIEAGMDNYLAKPLNTKKLEEIINSII